MQHTARRGARRRAPGSARSRSLVCLVLALGLLTGGSITGADADGLPAVTPSPFAVEREQQRDAQRQRKAAATIKAASDAELPEMNGAGITVTEFDTGIVEGQIEDITSGPDGNLWFTDQGGQVGRISPTGEVWLRSTPPGIVPLRIVAGADANLWFTTGMNSIGRMTVTGELFLHTIGLETVGSTHAITAGPDGNVWFTSSSSPKVGRMTPQGAVTLFSRSGGQSGVSDITGGADGNVWFTSFDGKIGRVTPAGGITEFALGEAPNRITAGPDGNVWFTDQITNGVTRVTPSGQGTFFGTGITAGANLSDIAHGPDGALWFGEAGLDKMGRITPTGIVSEFDLGIAPFSNINGVTSGPDGNIWFTEMNTNKIGRISGFGPTTPVKPGAPPAPTGTSGDKQVTVAWTAPSSDGGAPITSYKVTASPGGSSCTWTTGPLTCTVGGLLNGTSYTFTVAATNAVGTGPSSPPSSAVIPAGLPPAPAAVPGNVGFTVPASSPGVRPGISLVAGQTMTVRALGVGTYGNEGDPACSGVPMTDPTGRRKLANGFGGHKPCAIKPGTGALTKNAPIGALVARTSGSDWSAVFTPTATPDGAGAYTAVYTATAPGAVTFAYNDSSVKTDLANNGGSYQVVALTTQFLDAGAPAMPTSLKAQGGETLGVYANGLGSYGTEGETGCNGTVRTDAAGNRAMMSGGTAKACSPLQKFDGGAVLPSAPIGALLVRVGTGKWVAPFHKPSAPLTGDASAGYFATWISDADGAVQIQYNDVPGGNDNAGGYQVSVYAGWYGLSGAVHACQSVAVSFTRANGSALPKPLPADGTTDILAVAKVTNCLTGATIVNEPVTIDLFWPGGQAKALPAPTGGDGLVKIGFNPGKTPGQILAKAQTHSRDLNGWFTNHGTLDQLDPRWATEAGNSLVTADRGAVPADGKSIVNVIVHLRDGFKQPIAGAKATLFAPANSNVYCAGSCSATTDQNGRASIAVYATASSVVRFTIVDQTNNVTLTQWVEVYFEPLPSQKSRSSYQVDSWTVPADGVSPAAITAVMRDAADKPIVGTWVEIWPQSGSRAWCLGSCGAFTDATGRATVKVVDDTPEQVAFTITDRYNNVTLGSSPTITFEKGTELTNSKVTIDRSSAPADGITPVTFTVQLRDAAARPIRGAQVGIEASAGSRSFTYGSLTPVTDTNGNATFKMVSTSVESVRFAFTDLTNNVKLTYALQQPTVQFTAVPAPVITSVANTTRPDAAGSDVMNQSSDGVTPVYPGDVVEITGARLFGPNVVVHWGTAVCGQPHGDADWKNNDTTCTQVVQSEPGVVVDPAGGKIRVHVPAGAWSGVHEIWVTSGSSDSNKKLLRYRTDYVALGDSFSSGEGASSTDPSGYEYEKDTWKVPLASPDPLYKWANNCHRSKKAYPYHVRNELRADGIDLNFKFVACSGGIIANIAAVHADDPRKPTGPPPTSDGWLFYPNEGPDLQVANLSPGTGAVTITAGGNDLGFAPILGYCYAFRTKNILNPLQDCANKFWFFEDAAASNIAAMYPRLVRLYQTVRRLSGNAPVYVKGYPHLLKSGDGDEWHFSNKTKDFILERQNFLDSVMAQAAKAAGVHYIVDGAHMDGHTFDATDPWLNTLNLQHQTGDGDGLGKFAFHPNVRGQREAANLFLGQAGGSYCTSGASTVKSICDVSKLQPNPDPQPNLVPNFDFNANIKLGNKVPDHWWAFDRVDPTQAAACGAVDGCDLLLLGGKKSMDPEGRIQY